MRLERCRGNARVGIHLAVDFRDKKKCQRPRLDLMNRDRFQIETEAVKTGPIQPASANGFPRPTSPDDPNRV